ncbi:hypothetical protein MTO96_020361 [Rhipicephalus appendiculatus]
MVCFFRASRELKAPSLQGWLAGVSQCPVVSANKVRENNDTYPGGHSGYQLLSVATRSENNCPGDLSQDVTISVRKRLDRKSVEKRILGSEPRRGDIPASSHEARKVILRLYEVTAEKSGNARNTTRNNRRAASLRLPATPGRATVLWSVRTFGGVVSPSKGKGGQTFAPHSGKRQSRDCTQRSR